MEEPRNASSELTREQWLAIQDLLAGKVGDPGRTAESDRFFANAVLRIAGIGTYSTDSKTFDALDT